MVQAEQVQDGRVEVVGVNRINHGLEADLVGGPVRVPGLHAGPGKEGRERPVVVLAPLVVGRAIEWCAAKLRRPDDQRVVEQAALLKVCQQSVDRPVNLLGQALVIHHVPVRIPITGGTGVDQFDETNPALGQAPCRQTLPTKAVVLAGVQAVQFMCGIGFPCKIKRLRHGHLHPECGFKCPHSRRQFRVGRLPGQVLLVAPAQCRQLQFLQLARHARRDVGHRVAARHNARALMRSRQKVRAPNLTSGIGGVRRDHDERRQVLVFRAQPVAHPGADTRPRHGERAGVHAECGVVVVRVAGVHAVDERNVIHAPGHLREKRADLLAALAVSLELPLGCLEKNSLVAGPVLDFGMIPFGDLLAVVAVELRLVVERVEMRHAAAQIDENDAPSLRGKMRLPGRILVDLLRPHHVGDQRRHHHRAGDHRSQKMSSTWIVAERFHVSSRTKTRCCPTGHDTMRPTRGPRLRQQYRW